MSIAPEIIGKVKKLWYLKRLYINCADDTEVEK